jgi:NhaP-type Na+/H+ or K+/H+ antiporter
MTCKLLLILIILACAIVLSLDTGRPFSFAFGSLISAVDPVATLAIFQALDMDRTLYMMVGH